MFEFAGMGGIVNLREVYTRRSPPRHRTACRVDSNQMTWARTDLEHGPSPGAPTLVTDVSRSNTCSPRTEGCEHLAVRCWPCHLVVGNEDPKEDRFRICRLPMGCAVKPRSTAGIEETGQTFCWTASSSERR